MPFWRGIQGLAIAKKDIPGTEVLLPDVTKKPGHAVKKAHVLRAFSVFLRRSPGSCRKAVILREASLS
jgi:hypothetical protein